MECSEVDKFNIRNFTRSSVDIREVERICLIYGVCSNTDDKEDCDVCPLDVCCSRCFQGLGWYLV